MSDSSINVSNPINRREFLFYLWGASAFMLTAGACGAAGWLMFPRLAIRAPGTLLTFTPSQMPLPYSENPPITGAPDSRSQSFFWLTNTEQGLYALSIHCARCGGYFKWLPQGLPGHNKPCFACPICGSGYTKEGQAFRSRASHNLDSFAIEVTTPHGIVRTPNAGGPVPLNDATQIDVDVLSKINGSPRSLETIHNNF